MSTYTIKNLATPTSTFNTISGATGSTVTLSTGAGSNGTYLVTGGGVGGSTITTSNLSWANPSTNFTSSNGNAVMTMPYGEDKIVVAEKAALEVKGKMVLNGMDLEERLNTIETVLQIPTRDVTIEAKHPKLAELYKEYMHELEKYKTWDRIKGDEDGTT